MVKYEKFVGNKRLVWCLWLESNQLWLTHREHGQNLGQIQKNIKFNTPALK